MVHNHLLCSWLAACQALLSELGVKKAVQSLSVQCGGLDLIVSISSKGECHRPGTQGVGPQVAAPLIPINLTTLHSLTDPVLPCHCKLWLTENDQNQPQ